MSELSELKNILTFGDIISDEQIPKLADVDELFDDQEKRDYVNAHEYVRNAFKDFKDEIPAEYFAKAEFGKDYELCEDWESIKKKWHFFFGCQDPDLLEYYISPLKQYLADTGALEALKAGVPLEDIVA